MNLLSDLVDYAAATLTTLVFIPQTLHSWRSRDLSGVSLGMYSLFTIGVALWLLYGVVLESWERLPRVTQVFQETSCLTMGLLFS